MLLPSFLIRFRTGCAKLGNSIISCLQQSRLLSFVSSSLLLLIVLVVLPRYDKAADLDRMLVDEKWPLTEIRSGDTAGRGVYAKTSIKQGELLYETPEIYRVADPTAALEHHGTVEESRIPDLLRLLNYSSPHAVVAIKTLLQLKSSNDPRHRAYVDGMPDIASLSSTFPLLHTEIFDARLGPDARNWLVVGSVLLEREQTLKDRDLFLEKDDQSQIPGIDLREDREWLRLYIMVESRMFGLSSMLCDGAQSESETGRDEDLPVPQRRLAEDTVNIPRLSEDTKSETGRDGDLSQRRLSEDTVNIPRLSEDPNEFRGRGETSRSSGRSDAMTTFGHLSAWHRATWYALRSPRNSLKGGARARAVRDLYRAMTWGAEMSSAPKLREMSQIVPSSCRRQGRKKPSSALSELDWSDSIFVPYVDLLNHESRCVSSANSCAEENVYLRKLKDDSAEGGWVLRVFAAKNITENEELRWSYNPLSEFQTWSQYGFVRNLGYAMHTSPVFMYLDQNLENLEHGGPGADRFLFYTALVKDEIQVNGGWAEISNGFLAHLRFRALAREALEFESRFLAPPKEEAKFHDFVRSYFHGITTIRDTDDLPEREGEISEDNSWPQGHGMVDENSTPGEDATNIFQLDLTAEAMATLCPTFGARGCGPVSTDVEIAAWHSLVGLLQHQQQLLTRLQGFFNQTQTNMGEQSFLERTKIAIATWYAGMSWSKRPDMSVAERNIGLLLRDELGVIASYLQIAETVLALLEEAHLYAGKLLTTTGAGRADDTLLADIDYTSQAVKSVDFQNLGGFWTSAMAQIAPVMARLNEGALLEEYFSIGIIEVLQATVRNRNPVPETAGDWIEENLMRLKLTRDKLHQFKPEPWTWRSETPTESSVETDLANAATVVL